MTTEPPSYHPSPRRPALALPAGACDAHCHVFGPSAVFPFASERTFTPSDAPKEKLFALHRLLGLERTVIVQSQCHGYDNRVVLDAIAADPANVRGVALLPVDTGDAEIERLNDAGMRGARFNFMPHLTECAGIEGVVAFGDRLRDFGWHLQVHPASGLVADLAPILKRSAVPVVIDHMARVDASLGLDHPDFQALLRLMEDYRFWVKVSGCDRSSRQAPPYGDAIPYARLLVDRFPDRVLWGTDWPHPNHRAAPPDDGVLVDNLAEIAPDPAQLQALLVDNPARLYGFPTDTAAKRDGGGGRQ